MNWQGLLVLESCADEARGFFFSAAAATGRAAELVRRLGAKSLYYLHYREHDDVPQAAVAESCLRSRLQRKEERMREARSPSKAQTYRRKAQTCSQLAACARSKAEREPLLRM